MTQVGAGENEDFESLIRRFTKRVQQDNVLAEIRSRNHYEKPSIKRKEAVKRRKSARASRRL